MFLKVEKERHCRRGVPFCFNKNNQLQPKDILVCRHTCIFIHFYNSIFAINAGTYL